MRKLLLMLMTFSFCSILALPVLAQSTDANHKTVHTKPAPKHHKIINTPSNHPNTHEVCLSCIGSAQSK